MKIKLIESESREEFESMLKAVVDKARHVINVFFVKVNGEYAALLLYDGLEV